MKYTEGDSDDDLGSDSFVRTPARVTPRKSSGSARVDDAAGDSDVDMSPRPVSNKKSPAKRGRARATHDEEEEEIEESTPSKRRKGQQKVSEFFTIKGASK